MKFKCLNCEKSCCSKKTVALNKADFRRLVEGINRNGLDNTIFNYVIFREDLPEGKTVNGNEISGVLTLKQNEGNCVFLKDNMCSIHKFRPLPCRLYPCNPIFYESEKGYTLKIEEDTSCSGIGEGEEFNVMNIALQWRRERLEYNKFVDEWNERKDKNLIEFVKELLK